MPASGRLSITTGLGFITHLLSRLSHMAIRNPGQPGSFIWKRCSV